MRSLEDLPEPALVLGADGTVHEANALAARLLRVDDDALHGAPLAERLSEELTRAADGGGVWRAEVEGQRADGVPFPLDLVGRPLADEPDRSLVLLRDRNADGGTAALTMQAFDAAFDQSPIGMALYSTDGEFERVNDALAEMLGRSREELLGTRDQLVTHPDDRAADLAAAERIMRGELSVWQTEKRFVHADGSEVWVMANLAYLRDPAGRSIGWLGQFQDVTAHRSLAERDPLTQLYNRRRFELALDESLAHSVRYEPAGALIVFDLDGFKRVNDDYGHPAGDEVLVAVAGAVSARVRETDMVARLGGDEFAVILPHIDLEGAETLGRALVAVIAALPFSFAGGDRAVTASVGVAPFGETPTAESVLAAADAALYRVKRAGGNGCAV